MTIPVPRQKPYVPPTHCKCGESLEGKPEIWAGLMNRPAPVCSPHCGRLMVLGIAEWYKETPYKHRLPDGTDEDRFFTSYPVGKGWMPIVVKLNHVLSEIHPDYSIAQIKEKFGVLEYYTRDLPLWTEESRARGEAKRAEFNRIKEETGEFPKDWDWGHRGDDDYTPAYKLIEAARAEASRTCEDCGKPGIIRKGGVSGHWLRTECDDCGAGHEPHVWQTVVI
jgi:hypothetical protein